jgi:SAM-dependent methyltransferase
MSSPPDDLDRLVARTLSHYDRAAQDYWEGTRDHDVSQNVAALLRCIEAPSPFELLDFGCGPGRDLMTFTALGHRATGLEGSAPMAALARAHSGCRVLEQNFLALDLPPGHFDGVFANAALFHVPRQALPRVLRELHSALKPGGVLLSSNPRGKGEETLNGDRYGAYYDWETWRSYMTDAGFVELTHYYRPPGLPREQQPWLASVWRKPAVPPS